MKAFTKTLLAAGLYAAASAQAGMVSLKIYDNAGDGSNSFNSLLFSTVAFEDFDDLSFLTTDSDNDDVIDNSLLEDGADINDPNTDQQDKWVARTEGGQLKTRVGTFTLNEVGQELGNPHNDELMIENQNTGEFNRQNIEADGNWLDSNDAQVVTWDFYDFYNPVGETFNAIGFFLSDATDQGAKLTLKFSDANTQEFDLGQLKGQLDGNVKFVSITSDMDIEGGSLIFDNNGDTNDGWGIDNVTLGKLPEPGTLLLMGLGLLGLGAARRRVAQ